MKHETHEPISPRIENFATHIVDAAYHVHARLGPGLLESVYEHCLALELSSYGLQVGQQVGLPVRYRDLEIDAGYRVDLFVENCIVIELKSVTELLPIHRAQRITYLRLSRCRLGFLINFNTKVFQHGILRVAM